MTSHRQDRMAIEIQKILSEILQNEMKDPRISKDTVNISRVETTHDVSFAKVYFSILGNEAERQQIFRVLEKAKGFFRSQLAQRLPIRHVPELDFKIDTAIELGVKMSALLDELREMEHNDDAKE